MEGSRNPPWEMMPSASHGQLCFPSDLRSVDSCACRDTQWLLVVKVLAVGWDAANWGREVSLSRDILPDISFQSRLLLTAPLPK